MDFKKTFTLNEAVKAQQALRATAGLEPERFPVEAFVGMISDEIEALRQQGKTDSEIASLIQSTSAIEISAEELAEHYAPPEERHARS